jgi:hypothetical protein
VATTPPGSRRPLRLIDILKHQARPCNEARRWWADQYLDAEEAHL